MWKTPIILAGLVGLFGIGAAQAETLAYAVNSTALRTDPSSRSHVVASVPANAELTIGHCTSGWCFAHMGDRSGYVAASALDFDNEGGTVVEPSYVDPGYYPGPYVYGPSFYWGPGYYHGWHGGPGRWRR